MKASGRPARNDPRESIEFVPKRELDRVQQENEKLQTEIDRLKRENERLQQQLEAALRASKRQAAPHSRGEPKAHPKQPGRKPGQDYGRQSCRPIPRRIDEQIQVPLLERCPHCGGGVEPESSETQYQEEIVRRTVARRFDIEVGRCRQCRRRVQGRHPLQTSDAVGVGSVQLGPEALTLAAILNKQMGLSLGRTQQVPARRSLFNSMDETGWKVGGQLQWLHVAVSAPVTVYAILPGRGYEQAAELVGTSYEGFLVHDGWAPYYRFELAFHQSCLSHLLRRCREMAQIASSAAAAFPFAVKGLLQTSLELRDRYQRGEISEHGRRTATGRLEAKLDRLLDKRYRNPANQRLANHLLHEQPWLFTFLHCPGLDATNHAAERAIRGMVIARKVWGGNRSWEGARTQQILVSVLRTCWQQSQDAFVLLVSLLRSPCAAILDIVPGPG